jgi:hypothetical protein
MGFSWSALTAGSTLVNKSLIKEAKDNTESVNASVQISAFAWSELANTDNLDLVTTSAFQELRNAVDRAKDNNYCRAYCSTLYANDHSSNNPADYGTVHTGMDTGNYSTFDNGQNASVNSSQYTNDHGTYYATNDATLNSSVCGSYDAGVDGYNKVSNSSYNSAVDYTQYMYY